MPRERETDDSRENGACGFFHVCLRTADQLQALADAAAEYSNLRRVCLEADLVCEAMDAGAQDRTRFQELLWKLRAGGCVPVIALPPVIREKDKAFLAKLCKIYEENEALFGGFLARSMDGLGFLTQVSDKAQGGAIRGDGAKTRRERPAVYGDAGIYIWNRESLRILQRTGKSDDAGQEGMGIFLLDGFCMPYELSAQDQRKLLDAARIPCEKIVYGRIPLMITANCVVNTVYGCTRTGDAVCFLTDRYRKRFPVLTNCRHCMNIIYNSLPLSLHRELAKWRDRVNLRLDFTIEDGKETARILQYFLSGAQGDVPCGEYTTGHEKRGAE